MVGISGDSGERSLLVIPIGRSLPERMCAITGSASEKIICTWPPMRSCTASTPPLYCTPTMSIAAERLNISPTRCDMLPGPLVPKLSLPASFFARLTSSCTVFTGVFEFTTRMLGPVQIIDTGRKSRCMSYGNLERIGLIATGPKLPMTKLYPSAGRRAAYSMPIDPAAPGFDSMMTCWPQSSESFCPSTRPIRSDDPPGGYVTISRTGFDGYVCAAAPAAHRTAAIARTAHSAFLTGMDLPPVVVLLRRGGRAIVNRARRRALGRTRILDAPGFQCVAFGHCNRPAPRSRIAPFRSPTRR